MSSSSFPAFYDPASERIIVTPSTFAKAHLIYVQETGRLKLLEAKHSLCRCDLDSFLFVSVLRGEGTLVYQGQRVPITGNMCFLIDCRKPHSFHSDREHPWELRWVHFSGNNADEYYKMISERYDTVFTPLHLQAINQILLQITATNYRRSLEAELQSAMLLTQLLTLLLMDRREEVTDKMYEIQMFLRVHYQEKQTLDSLAERFDISKFYLHREFKRCFNETIVQYIAVLRTNRAKNLLRYSALSMSEIAEQCGYCDQNYFARRFTKTEGSTPSEYRKKWRGKR